MPCYFADVFRMDPQYEENEEKYQVLKKGKDLLMMHATAKLTKLE